MTPVDDFTVSLNSPTVGKMLPMAAETRRYSSWLHKTHGVLQKAPKPLLSSNLYSDKQIAQAMGMYHTSVNSV